MKVRVRYYGIVHDMVGARTESFNLQTPPKLIDLLREIVEKYPELERMMFNGEAFRDYLAVSVNNVDIMSLQGVDTMLRDGDQVFLMPPIGGG